ncbi:PIG-L family deacetylase [Streptomyces longisporoflavus]|uniref:PIG-L deacetylase family protein n=1 Tax=Streptomyces longisporoflavus TaxID=28044 RepID=UPI00167D16CC|nr:PIG-L family deacetylase [Streptomyces longisporoflavus]GGV26386.1 PIG-L family deacetylase [Streptomyces longisporoflavus]
MSTPRTRTPDRQAAAAAIDAPGTDEAMWRAARLADHLPRLVLPAGAVVVVAAHPDDEVLGFGGAIATLLAAGGSVHTVCLTDGEASHGPATPSALARLAARRRGELTAALGELGALPAPVHAALPDSALDEHEDEARAVIGELLDATGAALCVAPWENDLHSDHEAAGRAARGAGRDTATPVWSYPVWMWHWARPHDPRVPWHRASVLPLAQAALDRKEAALARFTSQLEPRGRGMPPVLPPQEIAHHTRTFETVLH